MEFRGAGIVWDPREPLPRGLQEALDGGYPIHGVRRDARPFHPLLAHQQPEHQHPEHQRPVHELKMDNLVIREPNRNILPPLSVSLKAQVVQDTAKVTVTQLFWNNANSAIPKGAYTFPLSAGCTVTGFSCRIGRHNIVKAKVKPKAEARNAFEDAVRSGQTTGLLEQNTPEIFTTTLGNIPANTKLKAELTFVTFLKHKFSDSWNAITLTIPTFIATRYGNPPAELQTAGRIGIPKGLNIQVDVVAAENMPKISSATHKITMEDGVAKSQYENWEEFAAAGGSGVKTVLVRLEDGLTFLDKDFVLDITTKGEDDLETPTAWLETHPSLENHQTLMLTIPEKFMLRNESASQDAEIIFLADRSGSMDDKMEALKSAMKFFLKGIPQVESSTSGASAAITRPCGHNPGIIQKELSRQPWNMFRINSAAIWEEPNFCQPCRPL